MNQILSTNNNNYNSNNYNKSDTKKIIMIFAILLIVIALAIIALKIYQIYNNKDTGNYAKPTIEIVREDEDSKEVTVRATCEDGIKTVFYTWDNGKENEVNLNASKEFERIIDIPSEENSILKIKVISVNGVTEERTEEFSLDVDNNKPKIESITLVNSKLQIEASDDNGIDYLAYQWEDEDEQRVYADEEDNKTISVELDIQRGTYELLITVVDVSGNEEKISKLITGVKEPEISAMKYGNVVEITVTHDMGFKRIEYLINDTLYVYDENISLYNKDETTIKLEFPLKEGENIIKVHAYSLEKLTDEEENDELENYSLKTFTGKCTYEPQG